MDKRDEANDVDFWEIGVPKKDVMEATLAGRKSVEKRLSQAIRQHFQKGEGNE